MSNFTPINLQAIRIARVSTVPFFVVTQLKHQISQLGEQGAHVNVVTSFGAELQLLNGMKGVACKVIDIPRAISPWRDLLALFRLFIFFRQTKIQIAHSTTPKAGLLTAIAAFFARVPIRVHTFTGQPWVSMFGFKRRVTRACDQIIGKLNTHCYADSKSQMQFLISEKIVNANCISVIGEGSLAGVDMARFNQERYSDEQCAALRASLGITTDAPVILFLGRITIDKGIQELIRAYQMIKSEGSNAHLLFVGPFDNESGSAGHISENEIQSLKDVHSIGHTTIPEAYLAIADVLCLPSYREGFGTVVIEAAAMGVPTVGTNIYGLSDAIVNGETGLLVPPKNAKALSIALNELLTKPMLRKSMGANAKARALKQFDASVINDKLIHEYVSLLKI